MQSRKLRPSAIPNPLSGGALHVAPIIPPRFRRLSVVTHVMMFLFGLVGLKLTGRYSSALLYQRIRELIERLSGLWIKAGQLASLRIDLLPMELCRELSKLQNRATGFPVEIARRILAEDLGRPLEEVFDEFDDTPIAAASIGQVHRAHLRQENLTVAVKIRRPNIADVYARDLALMRLGIGFLKLVDFMPHMRWHEIAWEIEQVMIEELDYRYEAAYARQMRKALREHGLLSPRIYRQFTTSRILVMEFMHGVLMSDYLHLAARDPVAAAAWCEDNDIVPRELAVKLMDSLMRQVFEENMFHGDLHPGNILLLKGNNAALIDFGTCGFTESAFIAKWRELFKTFGTKEFARIVDLYFLICNSSPAVQLRPIREEIMQRVHEWSRRSGVGSLPFSEKSVDNIAVAITKILAYHGFELGWSYLRIRRAVTSLDASIMELYPDIDYPAISRQHFGEAFGRAASRLAKRLPSETGRAVGVSLDIARRIPEAFTMSMAGMLQQVQIFGGDILRIGDLMLATTKRVAIVTTIAVIVLAYDHYGPAARAERAATPPTRESSR